MIPASVLRQVRRLHLRAKRQVQGLLGGAYHSAFKGAGVAVEDVREYQPGDDVRAIDWNVTARFGRPFIKRFVEERELTLLLVVDVSASLDFGSGGRSKRQAAAEAAALLAWCAAWNRDRVGLVMGGQTAERYLPPGRGVRHIQRLVRDVLAFTPRQTGTDLAALLQFVLRVQRRRAVVVLLSDFLADGYEGMLRRVARRHELLAIRLLDPLEEAWPAVGLVRLTDAERGTPLWVDTSDPEVRRHFQEQAAARDAAVAAACRGADRLTLRTTDDPLQVLVRFFRQRQRPRR